MMKKVSALVALLLATAFGTARAESPFVDLFASGDFTGWIVGNNGTGWRIQDGVVHLHQEKAGNLATRKTYKDFELAFDWKMSQGGNSGVIYRAQHGRGLEYQVLDDERHVRGKNPIWAAAALYDLVPPKSGKPYHPAGQWNTGRIIARGDHIEHWLNGEKVLEVELRGDDWDERYKKSKFVEYGFDNFGNVESSISFQDHGHPVWYRNVRIRELDK